MAKLLIANEVRIGGLGAVAAKRTVLRHFPTYNWGGHRGRFWIDFEADVPGGNWVTVGFDSPLVRPPTCIWGEWNGG